MAAPTTPTIPEMAGRSESEILAAIVEQARRCETAAGGTPPTSPSQAVLAGSGSMASLAELLASFRRLEDLL